MIRASPVIEYGGNNQNWFCEFAHATLVAFLHYCAITVMSMFMLLLFSWYSLIPWLRLWNKKIVIWIGKKIVDFGGRFFCSVHLSEIYFRQYWISSHLSTSMAVQLWSVKSSCFLFHEAFILILQISMFLWWYHLKDW